MRIADFIKLNNICADLKSTGQMNVLAELAKILEGDCPNTNEDQITQILVERERLATTGIGDGVAIPHGKLSGIDGICAAIGISRTGVPFDAVDGNTIHIFVALLAPQDSTGDHLKALARVSRLLKNPTFRSRLLESKTPTEIYDTLLEEDGKY